MRRQAMIVDKRRQELRRQIATLRGRLDGEVRAGAGLSLNFASSITGGRGRWSWLVAGAALLGWLVASRFNLSAIVDPVWRLILGWWQSASSPSAQEPTSKADAPDG